MRKFAFVTLSDPTGEYEVLFPPESLRKNRDHLEPGRSIILKVRTKGREGEVRFFGDDAMPLAGSLRTDDMGLRVHVSAQIIDLVGVAQASGRVQGAQWRRDQPDATDLVGEGEVEVKLPARYNARCPSARLAEDHARRVLYFEDV